MKNTSISTIGLSFVLAVMPISGVTAQDMPVLDPSAYSRPMVMHGAINAQARRNGDPASSRNGLSAKASATCANKAAAKSRYGADEPRVRKLYALCTKAGL